jgi:osmoprotectant transport system substrate-binding protein
MRFTRALALGASIVVLVSACSTGGGGKPTVKVGSDGFYEAKVMAEIYAQALEAGGYTVDRTGIGIGARKVSAPALETGQIDLKPEYIGSGLAFYEAGKQTGDPAANEAALQAVMATKGGGITVLSYAPAADQNAFVVRKETATQFKLAKLSDTTPVQDQLKWGLATDCKTNPVCAAALKSAYGLDPKNITPLAACDTPMAQALANKTIDVAELCSTQPDIAVNGFVVLADDKHTQPADNIAPLVRNDLLAKTDKTVFSKILNDVSAKMDTATLTNLNKQITVDKKDIAAVAKAWLQSVGLTK